MTMQKPVRRTRAERRRSGRGTCQTGWVRYRDEAEAKQAKTSVRYHVADGTMPDTGVMPVRAYHCRHCGGWHLTAEPSEGVSNA